MPSASPEHPAPTMDRFLEPSLGRRGLLQGPETQSSRHRVQSGHSFFVFLGATSEVILFSWFKDDCSSRIALQRSPRLCKEASQGAYVRRPQGRQGPWAPRLHSWSRHPVISRKQCKALATPKPELASFAAARDMLTRNVDMW